MAYINFSNNSRNPFSLLISIGIGVLVLVALFMLARFVFKILAFAAPILFLAALIFDYRTVVNYGKWLLDLTRRQPILGIAAILFSILGFPIVSVFLFGKALLKKQVRNIQKEQTQQAPQLGEYIEFEEVKTVRKERIELPPIQTRQQEQRRNEYERLFGDEE